MFLSSNTLHFLSISTLTPLLILKIILYLFLFLPVPSLPNHFRTISIIKYSYMNPEFNFEQILTMLSISSMRRYIKLDTNSSQHPLESIVTGAKGYKCETTGYYGAWAQSHFAFPFLHTFYLPIPPRC